MIPDRLSAKINVDKTAESFAEKISTTVNTISWHGPSNSTQS